MSSPNTVPCSRCSASIPIEDFKQGLAVRVQGKPVCKICVDAGSNQPQGPIQRTPLMQQNIYRYSHPKYDELNRFTFLTAGHIALHRRISREQGEFEPPELANNDAETQVFDKEAASKTTRLDLKKVKKSDNKTGLFVGIGIAALLLIGIIAFGLGTNESTQAPQDTEISNPQQTAASRSDFSNNPFKAWPIAAEALKSNDPVLTEIANEITSVSAKKLKKAQDLIEDKDSSGALDILNSLTIPEHQRFNNILARKNALIEERNQLISGIDNDNKDNFDDNNQTEHNSNNDDQQNKVAAITLEQKFILEDSINNVNTIDNLADGNTLAYTNDCTNQKIKNLNLYQFTGKGSIRIKENLEHPHSFTLAFWFKIDPDNKSEGQWLLSHGPKNSNGSINIYFNKSSSNRSRNLHTVIAHNDIAALQINDDKWSFSDGAWHHYCLVIDHENGAQVYFDRQLATSDANIKGPLSPNTTLALGHSYRKANYLNGAMSQFSYYHGSMSENEVSSLFGQHSETFNSTDVQMGIDLTPINITAKKHPVIYKDHSTLPSPYLDSAWLEQGKIGFDDDGYEICADDFNADGIADIAAVSKNATYLLINDGSGTFAAPQEFDVAHGFRSFISSSDLNNDGYPDIILSPEPNGKELIIYLYSKSTGDFKKYIGPSLKGNALGAARIVDLNGDHRPDIYVARASGGFIIYNTGNFDSINSWPRCNVSGNHNYAHALVDVNNDKYPDILQAQYKSNLYYQINHKKHSFSKKMTFSDNYKIHPAKLFHFTFNKQRYLLSFQQGKGNLELKYDKTENKFIESNDLTCDDKWGKVLAQISPNEHIFYKSPTDRKTNSARLILYSPIKDQGKVTLSDNLETTVHTPQSADFNNDGYMDIAFLLKSKDNKQSIRCYFRNPDATENTNNQTSDNNQNSSTAQSNNAPDPVIVSKFSTKSKSVSIFDKSMGAHNLPENFLKNPKENNFPFALKSKQGEIKVKFGERNALNGGVTLIINSEEDKERRGSLLATFTDKNGTEAGPYTINLTPYHWQAYSIDFRKPPEAFEADKIQSLLIETPEGASKSLPYYLYRCAFYSDHHPKPDDLNTESRKVFFEPRKFSFKSDKPIICIHPKFDDANFKKDLREQLNTILDNKLSTTDFLVFDINSTWIDKVLKKKIKRSSFVLALGAGLDSSLNNNSVESIKFWQDFSNTCVKSKALPIIIAGPGSDNNSKADVLWNDLFGKKFNTHKSYKHFPLVNLKSAYFDNNNRFKRNMRAKALRDIVICYHDMLARLGYYKSK